MLFIKQLLPICCLTLLFSGCSTWFNHKTNNTAQPHDLTWQTQLKRLNAFSFEGRIGYISTQASGSGNIYWNQQQDQFDISLSGPFKLGATNIQGNDKDTSIQNKQQQLNILTKELPSWFLQQGIHLPPLHTWLSMLKADIKTLGFVPISIENHENNLPKSIEFTHSNLKYDQFKAYQHANQTIWLPHKLKYQTQDHKINLKIYKWYIQNPK